MNTNIKIIFSQIHMLFLLYGIYALLENKHAEYTDLIIYALVVLFIIDIATYVVKWQKTDEQLEEDKKKTLKEANGLSILIVFANGGVLFLGWITLFWLPITNPIFLYELILIYSAFMLKLNKISRWLRTTNKFPKEEEIIF